MTVVFLFACMMLALLVHEQDRTIDSQRVLIRQLFQDSLELHAVKLRAMHPENR